MDVIDFEKKIDTLKEKGLYRKMRCVTSPQGPRTSVDGKEVIFLASNSYLGLAYDKRIIQAAVQALHRYGFGSGGSRLVSGCYDIHMALEDALVEFKKYDSCLLFSTGYAANVGVISGIADKEWVIFCDRLNHASIIDGIRLSGAKLVVYNHCDMDDLKKKIGKYHRGKGLIVTDGVFSMDGDMAPLRDIITIAKEYELLSMVDDAHAIGVLGENGRGTDEHFGIENSVDIIVGTLSKALAGEGGFVLARKPIIEYLRHKAKSFIYSTAMPPSNAAASLAALEIIQNEPERIKMVREKSQYFRKKLQENEIPVSEGETPILPVIVGDPYKTVELGQKLFEEGIYVPVIRPPTVPHGSSRLRFSIMSTHSYEDLDFVAEKVCSLLRHTSHG